MDTPPSHNCENTKLLTDIQIQLATIVQSLEESRVMQDDYMHRMEDNISDIKSIVSRHEIEITDLKHNCRVPEWWDSMWKRVKILEEDYQRRQGAGKWEERIYKYIEYGICVILGACIMWWMTGKFS